ncbi:MAG: glycosyltransferase family 1 protein [Chloroflexi bacterium]|nr:glycosyltransferase family 1 protein [Chloroflexota bacterium]
MKILILTIGSRGDVQPFVALGRGLQAAGFAVTLCTASSYASFVTDYGLKYAHMDDGLIRLADTKMGRAAVEGGSKLELMKQVQPIIRRMLNDAWAAAPGADAIIYHPKTLAGYHLGEKLGVPVFLSLPLPMYTPTSAFPNPVFNLRLGGWFNRLTYAMLPLLSAPYMGTVNAWRKEVLGLPPRSRLAGETTAPDGRPMPTLYSYSAYVVPTPPDWPETAVATGYWFLDRRDDWQPPADLVRFLDAGAPPVYIGFGSMTGTQPEAKARIALEALAQTGQRGLLATGWGGLKAADLPPTVFALQEAPHDWLFPRVAAVVHHGGAGTTAAGLRAGRPSIICPFMGDQFFWGQRVADLGVGPQPIPQKQLTADRLAEAIRAAASDTAMQQRAAELGQKLRAEDGVGRAVAIIRQRLGVAQAETA